MRRIVTLLLKGLVGLAAAFVALILVVTLLMAVGVIKPDTPKPPFPSVIVQATASAPPKAAAKELPQPAPPASVAAVVAAAPKESRCEIRADGDAIVPLFPTEEGLDEWESAQVHHDEKGALAAMLANGAFAVKGGTACAWLDRGIMRTRVRVLEGPHALQAGWVPTEWSIGK